MSVVKSDGLSLRTWSIDDAPAVARLANNRRIWRNLRDVFPNPYTEADARAWIGRILAGADDAVSLAIEVDGAIAGSIGCRLHDDVESKTGEIGYWLGEPYWGRGIATKAVSAFCNYLFDDLDLNRLEAGVYAWNPASARVLSKAGFRYEGCLEGAVFKDGEVTDKLMFGRVNPALERSRPVNATLAAFALGGVAP